MITQAMDDGNVTYYVHDSEMGLLAAMEDNDMYYYEYDGEGYVLSIMHW